MRQAPIDELMKRCGSAYKLVVVAARRAKELAEGSPKLISTDMKKVASIALEEIHQGKVGLKIEDDAAGKKERKGKHAETAKKK